MDVAIQTPVERAGWDNLVHQDMPLDEFKREMARCGFDWVKEVGFVHIHVFEHRLTGQPLVVTVERGLVAAPYVEQARKICDQLRGDAEPTL